jgi:WD40 repeat protein
VVWGASFSPDGKNIVTASADETARLWDAASGLELRKFTGHTEVVSDAIFSPDGKSVLTTSRDKTARLWDVATGEQMRVYAGHTNWVNRAAFSPDGNTLVTTSGWNPVFGMSHAETLLVTPLPGISIGSPSRLMANGWSPVGKRPHAASGSATGEDSVKLPLVGSWRCFLT